MDDKTLRHAEQFLTEADPALGAIIASLQLTERTGRSDYFSSLCRSIIGQQVSVAAASAIFKRFEASTNLDPVIVAALDESTIKEIGLSKQKASYLHDLAVHFVKDPNIYNHLDSLSDDAVISELVAVKGIGVWTAQMFLMFTLARPDVFAVDDVGLQNAMLKLYDWDTLPHKKELIAIAEVWSPYRSIASLYLWESLNNSPA